ncbi:putative aldouronate transport system permease protein [Cohnella sp. OV330]|uniref:ABC transporter permease n=1 Tax=Cohnella sp. OV330 TaxID=1855288 RepID=UPI0008EF080E|nr:ABC transporter permease subunit [Cohnella sp. OV330]SFA79784.1 putative aldouronate transport system permease protein [Cohnella sp. OV330]
MRVLNSFKRDYTLHLMLVPALLLVLIFSYYPMFGFVIAFEKFVAHKGFFHSQWIGFDNFRYIFKMPDFWPAFRNTAIIAILKIVGNLIVPIVIALLLNEVRQTFIKRGVQILVYLPHFLSWVILAGILKDILSPSGGIVNELISALGFKPIFFLGDNHWFRFTLIASDVWKEFGFNTIVYTAALTSINPSLYEAAVVDGASRWKQTLYITLPGIVPIIILLATISLGNVLNAGFDQVFNLYSPVTYSTGDILDTLVYRVGIVSAQYSVSTAIGLFKSIISFVLICASYGLAYRLANYRIF